VSMGNSTRAATRMPSSATINWAVLMAAREPLLRTECCVEDFVSQSRACFFREVNHDLERTSRRPVLPHGLSQSTTPNLPHPKSLSFHHLEWAAQDSNL